jgi:tetratricopeptide (TPR) repeat protein
VQAIAGEMFFRNKRYPEALTYLDRASDVLPAQHQIELLRGRTLEKMHRRGEAVEAYRRVLRLAPESKEAEEAAKGLRRLGAVE